MGVADAVVSTFHIVLFSGMDLVLPASRMFHQLRTSGACTGAPTHHKGYPSSQGVLLIARGTPHRKEYPSSQGADSSQGVLLISRGRLITKCHWSSKSATTHYKIHWSQNATSGHKVFPPESSVRLAAETTLSKYTEVVPQSASESATTDHKVPPPIIQNLRSDCASSQQRCCRRHSMFLQVSALE